MAWRSLLLLALVIGVTGSDHHAATNLATNSEDPNTCQGCRKIISFVHQFNSTSRDEAVDVLKNLCERFYPPSNDFQQGPCSMFVQGLFFVMDNTDPITHCDDIGACGPKQPSDDIYEYLRRSNSLEDEQPEANDDTICEFCHNLVDQFKAVVLAPEGVDRILDNVDEFCSHLKVIEKDQVCVEVVRRYIKMVKAIIKVVDPKSYCVKLTQCKPERLIRSPNSAQGQLPTLADFNNFGIETSVSIGPKPATLSTTTDIKKTPQCALCKTLVKEMFHFLRDNKTEANIIKGLDRVCRVVYPSEPNRGQCESMVKAYTRELVQLLVDETDPEVICMLLEQCAYSEDLTNQQRNQPKLAQISTAKPETRQGAYDLARLITALDPSIEVESPRSCLECKMFIRYLKDKLNNPKSQVELKQWLLENLCKELPEKSLVESCSSMVEAYSDVFFKAIAGDLNPTTACIELKVCNRFMMTSKFDLDAIKMEIPTPSFSEPAKRKSSGEGRCNRCKDVVAYIDDHLGTHPINEVLATVSKVCDNTNRSVRRGDNTDNSLSRGECMSMVKQYGTDMVQLIPTMESPLHLCKQIALC